MEPKDENKKRKKGDLRFYKNCLNNIQNSILSRGKVEGVGPFQNLSATNLTFDELSNNLNEETLWSAQDCVPNAAHQANASSFRIAVVEELNESKTLITSCSDQKTDKRRIGQSLPSPQILQSSSGSLPLTRSMFKSPDVVASVQLAKTKGSVSFSPSILVDIASGTTLKETRIISNANFTCPRSVGTSGTTSAV